MSPRLACSGLERTGIDPDGLLVARAQRSDREAFEELVRCHAVRARGVVRRLSPSEAEADERRGWPATPAPASAHPVAACRRSPRPVAGPGSLNRPVAARV